MLLNTFFITALVAGASATKLYVSSYAGTITTLDLAESNGKYSLNKLYSHNGCQPNASWITLDTQHSNLYCLDEGTVSGYGTLNSFKLNEDNGTLTQVNRSMTVDAPVNSAIYTSPNGSQLLAVAHYASALTTWRLDPATGSTTLHQNISFANDKPGPNKARQTASHPHQVLVDPQNKYLLVPDLGCDVVRVYSIDPQTLTLSTRTSMPVAPGSGPRHGRFLKTTNSTFYYLVTELASTLTGYQTTYLPNNGGLNLTSVVNGTAYGPDANQTAFAFNAAAEVYVSRDSESLIVSNRNATYFTITNPDPKNSTKLPSDAMATFPISVDGKVTFGGLTPAGGSFPRHFSENQDGSLVAVGLQNTDSVVIYKGTKGTGKLGTEVLAYYGGLGSVTSVVWGK